MRSASSMAISSKGLMTHLTLSVAIPEPSGSTRMVVAGSGTRLMGTRIFTVILLHAYGHAAMRISQNAREGSDKRNESNSGLYFSQTSSDEWKSADYADFR